MANNITRWRKEDAPNLLLAIDPGASYPKSKVPYCGAALFQWGMLVAARLVKVPVETPPFQRYNVLVRRTCKELNIARHDNDIGESPAVVAVEQPRLYRKGEAKPSDIIALKGIYGAFMGGIDAEIYSGPAPGEWKGSIDPTQLNERVCVVLNQAEQLILINAQRDGLGGLSDHVLDAVGVGLFTLGRAGCAMVV